MKLVENNLSVSDNFDYNLKKLPKFALGETFLCKKGICISVSSVAIVKSVL